jgi:hypothetical protein
MGQQETAMNAKKRPMIIGPKTDSILAGALTVASGRMFREEPLARPLSFLKSRLLCAFSNT